MSTAVLVERLTRPTPGALASPDRLDRAVGEWTALASVPQGCFIAGRWQPAEGGKTLAVEDPATESTLGRVSDASATDCLAALAAASDAAPGWQRTAARERARILRRASERLLDESERFALVLSLESGKPIAEARDEVAFAAEYLEWGALEATRICGRVDHDPTGECRLVVSRRPVGPCLVVTPWNFPLAIPARGVAPALAAGCTVVLRPSDRAPLSGLLLAAALEASGLPAGCLNVVVASDGPATDPLLSDRRLRKLTFTGSAGVGARLLACSAPRALRVMAELGGNAPFIVLEDADLDEAADAAVAAKCRNGGQACTAADRFYVARQVADSFTARLARRMGALRLGAGTDPATDMGPMISAAAAGRLEGLVKDALAGGARAVLGGGRRQGPGHYFAPVVLADVAHDARVMSEETFGPVAAICPVDSEEEAVALANDCDAGLAAYVMGADPVRAARLAERLEVGMVALNRGRVSCVAAPFGGVKGSGFGRSGGREGIEEYLETSYVALPEVA